MAIGSTSPAHAESATGSATAVVLRTGLDVSLLNNAAHLPLNVAVNDVQAPADAHKTLLTAELKGVNNNRRFSVLRADVATSRATANARRSQGYANLTRATVLLPGLPMSGLVEVEAATSTATCAVGKRPTAHITMAANVTVLGKKVAVPAHGAVDVDVPGTGHVRLALSKKTKSSSTAAATALQLDVAVNPAHLNVAKVKGTVTLVQATCRTPGTPGSSTGGSSSDGGSSSGGSSSEGSSSEGSSTGGTATGGSTSGDASTGGSGTSTQTGADPSDQNLAETGGSSSTNYIAGAAAALVAAGGGALFVSRRRKSHV